LTKRFQSEEDRLKKNLMQFQNTERPSRFHFIPRMSRLIFLAQSLNVSGSSSLAFWAGIHVPVFYLPVLLHRPSHHSDSWLSSRRTNRTNSELVPILKAWPDCRTLTNKWAEWNGQFDNFSQIRLLNSANWEVCLLRNLMIQVNTAPCVNAR
jgi:hypothetical protein